MKHERGFTLLEVLVAFAILTLSLGVVMQIFSTGLNNLALGDEYSRATLLAQSRLAALGIEEPLKAGDESGDFGDGYHWHVTVTPYDLPQSNEGRPDSDLSALAGSFQSKRPGLRTAGTGGAPVDAFDVMVEVTWGQGRQERSVALRSLRIAPPSPP